MNTEQNTRLFYFKYHNHINNCAICTYLKFFNKEPETGRVAYKAW